MRHARSLLVGLLAVGCTHAATPAHSVTSPVLVVEARAPRPAPTAPTGYVRVAFLRGYGCALRADGQLWCWGGEVRDPDHRTEGDVLERATPRRVITAALVAIEPGLGTLHGLDAEGNVWTIAEDQTQHVLTVSDSPLMTGIRTLWPSEGTRVCGELRDTAVRCAISQAGTWAVTEVEALRGYTRGAIGMQTLRAISPDGSVREVTFGVGNVTTHRDLPGAPARALATDGTHWCTVREAGEAECSNWQPTLAEAAAFRTPGLLRMRGDRFVWVRDDGRLTVSTDASNVGDGYLRRDDRDDILRRVVSFDDVVRPRDIAVLAGVTCIVTEAGELRCSGDTISTMVAAPGAMMVSRQTALEGVRAMVLMPTSSCALDAEGQAVCWGNLDALCQDVSSAVRPLAFPSFGAVASMHSIGDETLVVRRDGQVLRLSADRLARDGDTLTERPVNEEEHEDSWTRITLRPWFQAPGQQFVAPVLDNTLWAGEGGLRTVARTATRLPDATTVAVAGTLHVASQGARHCYWSEQSPVRCFGDNRDEQLVRRAQPQIALPGVEHEGLGRVRMVAFGDAHGCAVTDEGEVRCWGRNDSGQLGLGDRRDRAVPTAIAGLGAMAGVAASDDAACAWSAEGRVWCWGNNQRGLVGDGTHRDRISPTPITSLSDIAEVQMTHGHACARSRSGRLWCWGNNQSGVLGDGSDQLRRAPVAVLAAGSLAQL